MAVGAAPTAVEPDSSMVAAVGAACWTTGVAICCTTVVGADRTTVGAASIAVGAATTLVGTGTVVGRTCLIGVGDATIGKICEVFTVGSGWVEVVRVGRPMLCAPTPSRPRQRTATTARVAERRMDRFISAGDPTPYHYRSGHAQAR